MIENFVQYAMKSYENPHCTTIEEFEKDLERISYLNKLFYRYYEKSDLNAGLMLNHIIILYNVFDVEACTEMLFFKTKKEYWSGLKTFLTFLSYMPNYIKSVSIKDSDIAIDNKIADELRKI
jgi:hypothetical protein